jgi:hypothetical protein
MFHRYYHITACVAATTPCTAHVLRAHTYECSTTTTNTCVITNIAIVATTTSSSKMTTIAVRTTTVIGVPITMIIIATMIAAFTIASAATNNTTIVVAIVVGFVAMYSIYIYIFIVYTRPYTDVYTHNCVNVADRIPCDEILCTTINSSVQLHAGGLGTA